MAEPEPLQPACGQACQPSLSRTQPTSPSGAAASQPIAVKAVSVETLVAAIHQASSEPIRKRASEVGCQIRAENGVATAISLIEDHAKAYHRAI